MKEGTGIGLLLGGLIVGSLVNAYNNRQLRKRLDAAVTDSAGLRMETSMLEREHAEHINDLNQRLVDVETNGCASKSRRSSNQRSSTGNPFLDMLFNQKEGRKQSGEFEHPLSSLFRDIEKEQRKASNKQQDEELRREEDKLQKNKTEQQ